MSDLRASFLAWLKEAKNNHPGLSDLKIAENLIRNERDKYDKFQENESKKHNS